VVDLSEGFSLKFVFILLVYTIIEGVLSENENWWMLKMV